MNRYVTRGFILWLAVVGCAPLPSPGPPTPVDALPPVEGAYARAEAAFTHPRTAGRVREAAVNYEAAAHAPETAADAFWKTSRAYAWLAQFAHESDEQREADIVRGIDFARRAIDAAPQQADAHYYLAVTIGLFSELRAAVIHLPEVAKAAEQAAALDPLIDHAGPYRLLGSLYGLAPEPPVSLGDEEKGLDYLQRAVELAPDEPENHYRLAELLAAVGKPAEAKHHLKQALFVKSRDADPTETLEWQQAARKLLKQLK